MSLSELTRNSFQSGISAKKWVNLCKLFLANHGIHIAIDEVQIEISNSVLVLYRTYPGDPALQGYLKCAIQDNLLTLPRFVSTFLLAAQSPDLQNIATLDMLCRVALDSHYASGLSTVGSLVLYSDSAIDLLGSVQNAMILLRVAYHLPSSHFHQLTTSASELLTLLLSCVGDFSQISTAQALVHFAEASDLLQLPRLIPAVRQELESFALSLSLLLGDDAKAAREAQMMHTLHLAYTKSDPMQSGSDTDLVSCGLVLHSFVLNRANDFSAGDERHAVAVLVGLFRWLSWSSMIFFKQLLISAVSCVAQNTSSSVSSSEVIWRAFVIGRLPFLLSTFRKAAESEGLVDNGWHKSMQVAVSEVLNRADILEKCDHPQPSGNNDVSTEGSGCPRSFSRGFLHQLAAAGLVDASFAATTTPSPFNDFTPRITTEARDAGMDVASYFESRFLADNNNFDDAVVLAERMCKDPCSHANFAEAVRKRFTTLNQPSDVEPLSHICKILLHCEPAIDIVSLHVSLRELLGATLIFLEDYDCETVGDPQTAVSHLGEVVLFLQETVARYNLAYMKITVGDRKANVDFIRPVAVVRQVNDSKDEEANAFQAWNKALFDSSSEGIEDSILRNTRPKTLLRITASLFAHAIAMCSERKIEKEVLINGIQYFLGNLLNWTLAGTVRWLLTEIGHRSFNAPIHLDVLQTLILSQSCPRSVLRLSAPGILRLFPPKHERSRTVAFDPSPIRQVALRTLGLPLDEAIPNSLTLDTPGIHGADQATHAVRHVLVAARSGKAPALDLDRCLLAITPARFLYTLWTELVVAASMGEIEISRRIATFTLTMPRRSQSPPLLPIFLHIYLPGIVTGADALPPSEQAVTVELLVSVVASALTAALHTERALLTVCGDQRLVFGQSAPAMARKLGSDLRTLGQSHHTSSVVAQRLASSPAFVASFPTFMADL